MEHGARTLLACVFRSVAPRAACKKKREREISVASRAPKGRPLKVAPHHLCSLRMISSGFYRAAFVLLKPGGTAGMQRVAAITFRRTVSGANIQSHFCSPELSSCVLFFFCFSSPQIAKRSLLGHCLTQTWLNTEIFSELTFRFFLHGVKKSAVFFLPSKISAKCYSRSRFVSVLL